MTELGHYGYMLVEGGVPVPNHDGPESAFLSESEEIALLKDIAESLNEANDVAQAMAAILPRLGRVLGLTTAWAFRFDETRASFVEVGASGLPPALARDDAAALKSSWCECQDRLVKGRLDSAVNIVRCSRLRDAVGDRQNLKFHASIPMKMNGRALGILNVAADGATVFTKPALDLLRAIGYHVAVTMDRAALVADMRRRNQPLQSLGELVRELTQIANRSQLLEQAVVLGATRLQYEAAALLDESGVIASSILGTRPEIEYSYREKDSVLLPAKDRKVLADACSGIEVPVPKHPFILRVESRRVGAFGPIDEEILSAYAWYLTTLLDQIMLHEQAVDAARWAERRRLAADLHDSVSQHLFSAQLIARTLSQSQDAAASRDLPGRLESVIRATQAEMRKLVETLRPDGTPLHVELRHRLTRLKDVAGVSVTGNIAEVAWPIPDALQAVCLRIADEAMHNALKHGGGAPVEVLLTESDHEVVLEIADKGPGFDVRSAPRGYGLTTMRERAESAGLPLAVDSAVGRGTRIRLRLPKTGGQNLA